jgi:type IV pilus assembly protein PilN
VIRVNLLPQRRDARAVTTTQGSQRWLLLILAAVVLEVVGLFLFHQVKVEELEKHTNENKKLQAQIDEIKKLVSNHEDVKKSLTVLRAREDAIAQLQAGRSGPTAVLLELAQLLTPGKGPTADPDKLAQLRKENPLAVYNPSWDSRRLWITGYEERERTVRIEGLARDANDVSELAQRLKLSVYFYDVTILPGKKEAETPTKVEMVNFALQLKVRY